MFYIQARDLSDNLLYYIVGSSDPNSKIVRSLFFFFFHCRSNADLKRTLEGCKNSTDPGS